MKLFEGKSNIKVRILCDSVSSATGDRLTTFEVEYPRIIHSELMTHRMFSRNAASSRAIPFAKMKEQLNGRPVRFGANVTGMQDNGEHTAGILGRPTFIDSEGNEYRPFLTPEEAWEAAKQDAVFWSEAFSEAGYHKQVFNRLTESSQMMKVVISATQYDNFFWLRDDDAADPTLRELARLMREAYNDSKPMLLYPGEWHLPYVARVRMDSMRYCLEEDGVLQFPSLTLDEAIKVSCARCAAVSFRNTDYDVEKSRQVYDRLVGSDRKHASAFEHCATPMQKEFVDYSAVSDEDMGVNVVDVPSTWEQGITHVDKNYKLWSGNFKGFIQYRKLIPGENYEG